MDIPSVTPVNPLTPPASSAADTPGSGFAEALAAELPEPEQAGPTPESASAAGDMPGEAALVTGLPGNGTASPETASLAAASGMAPAMPGADTTAATTGAGDGGNPSSPAAYTPLRARTVAETAGGANLNTASHELDSAAGALPRQGPETGASVTATAEAAAQDAIALENMAGPAQAGTVANAASAATATPAAATPGLAPAWIMASAATPAAATGLPQLDAPLPLQHRDWAAQFSERIAFSVSLGLQAAELRISPEELGPISVRISLDRDEASVMFISVHPQVREVIEQALPQLRDSLQQAGLQLGEAFVSGGDLQRGQERGAQHNGGAAHGKPAAAEEALPLAPAHPAATMLLVDTYA